VPLHHASPGDPRVLDNAPVAVLLAILPANSAPERFQSTSCVPHHVSDKHALDQPRGLFGYLTQIRLANMFGLFLHEGQAPRRHRIDYLGSGLMMFGAGALMLALVQVGNSGEMATIAALAAGGVVALLALAAHERGLPRCGPGVRHPSSAARLAQGPCQFADNDDC
jgi:hypothetical protein